jgi:hypothetical protein
MNLKYTPSYTYPVNSMEVSVGSSIYSYLQKSKTIKFADSLKILFKGNKKIFLKNNCVASYLDSYVKEDKVYIEFQFNSLPDIMSFQLIESDIGMNVGIYTNNYYCNNCDMIVTDELCACNMDNIILNSLIITDISIIDKKEVNANYSIDRLISHRYFYDIQDINFYDEPLF